VRGLSVPPRSAVGVASVDTHDAESPNELRAAAAAETVSPAESRELRRAAADWELSAYRVSLLEDAIARYDEYTGSPVSA